MSEAIDGAIRRGLVAEGLFEVQTLPLGPEAAEGALRALAETQADADDP
jgi:hypothetical protein